MTKFKKARVDIYHEKFYRYLMEGHKREEEVDLDVCTLDILFPSNHNIHKSSSDHCFWASDHLIDGFY